MKAAMYMPTLQPGSVSWTIYQDLASAVRDLGHDIEVWTDPTDPASESQGTVFLEGSGSLGLDLLLAPFLRSQRLLSTARMLAAKLRASRDLDLLYTEIAYPFGTAAALGRRVAHWSGKLVVKPTGEDVHSVPEAGYGFGRYAAPRMLTEWTLRQADAVRCISPLVLEAIATRTTAMRRVIPSGVANSTVDEARRDLGVARADRERCRREVAAEFGLRDSKVVLALGRIHPIKGLEYLVRAMARVRDTVLILAGPSLSVRPHGDHATHLRSIASEEGVSARVRFPGYIAHERVHHLLAAADVLVIPSLLESMNKVAVEAAASGTPFVVTETTGVWEFVRRDGIGRAVPPRDSQALACAITDILDGCWRFDHDAAREFVLQFAPASVAPQLVELFEDTLR